MSIVKPVLSDHASAWAKKKWSLNRGGLLIEVKMHCKATIGTRPSGRSLNTGGHKSRFHCIWFPRVWGMGYGDTGCEYLVSKGMGYGVWGYWV